MAAVSRPARPALERFWEKVDQDGPVPQDRPELGGCWSWTGSVSTRGYGTLWAAGLAHRFAYQALVRPIPDGLTIDHLCRNRLCVNPAHLEPVTRGDNARRGGNGAKTHCQHGHPFTEANTYRQRNGGRVCRTCKRDKERQRAPRRRTPAR